MRALLTEGTDKKCAGEYEEPRFSPLRVEGIYTPDDDDISQI